MSCFFIFRSGPKHQHSKKSRIEDILNKDILFARRNENGLCDDRIANQSMKYKPSLLPDDHISSQSIKYKSNGTSSSTNESSLIQLTSLSSFIFYFFLYCVYSKNPEPLSWSWGTLFGLLPEAVLPKLQFY